MHQFRQQTTLSGMRFDTPLAMALLATITICGCGGSSNERPVPEGLVPLTGTVTLNGEPADGVSINFTPARGNTGQGGFAGTDAQGNFSARHLSQMGPDVDPATYGLEPGDYYVNFSRIRLPDGGPLPADMGESGKTAADLGARQSLPARYTQGGEMSQTVKVPYSGEKLVFELKMKE